MVGEVCHNLYCLAVAGDDVTIWTNRSNADLLKKVILDTSARSVAEKSIGFGQCYKDVHIAEWHNFDFCSKWSYSDRDPVNLDHWYMTRDLNKAILTGHVYSGTDPNMILTPEIHSYLFGEAILRDTYCEIPALSFYACSRITQGL